MREARTRSQAICIFLLSLTFTLGLSLLVIPESNRGKAATPELTPTPTPTPTPTCPQVVNVTCPPFTSPTIVFTANIVNPIPGTNPTYNWSVDPRSLTPDVTNGQSLTIQTEERGRAPITAKVAVENLGPNCPQLTNFCRIEPGVAGDAVKISELNIAASESEQDRQAQFTEAEYAKDRSNYVYLVAHEQVGASAAIQNQDVNRMLAFNQSEFLQDIGYGLNDSDSLSLSQDRTPPGNSPAIAFANKLKELLVKKGVLRDHIIILRSNEPRLQVTVEIFIGPAGARLPVVAQASTPIVLESDFEVRWQVVPREITSMNFGKGVGKHFYVIEVSIGNNSQAEFQLLSFAFDLNNPMLRGSGPSPSSDYRLVRGSILHEQERGKRNMSLALITGAGEVLTGFLPFFHVTSHRANYSQFINILSNPIRSGFEIFFPDRTMEHLTKLENTAWHGTSTSTVSIPSNRQLITYIFFPKDVLRLGKNERDQPQVIRQRLSNLIIIGSAIQHVTTIRKVQP